MDDFDKFFLECSKYIFPTDLMEDLNHKILIFSGYLERLQNLDYIVSEAWLGSTDINLFRAVAFETKGTKTLYNEHNCFFHPYVGDLVNYQSKLSGSIFDHGLDFKNPKFLSSGSLFHSNTNAQPLPNISICMLVIQSLKLRPFTHPCTPILIIPVICTYSSSKNSFPF